MVTLIGFEIVQNSNYPDSNYLDSTVLRCWCWLTHRVKLRNWDHRVVDTAFYVVGNRISAQSGALLGSWGGRQCVALLGSWGGRHSMVHYWTHEWQTVCCITGLMGW